MKPVDQTIFDNVRGNCMAACVAAILDLDLPDVPNFVESSNHLSALTSWLAKRGMAFQQYQLDRRRPVLWRIIGGPEYHLLAGPSPRGPWGHCVVGRKGEIVFDPHPDRRGLLSVTSATLFGPVGNSETFGARRGR